MPLVSFNTPWKHQKTRGFLMFSDGIEREQRYEMQKPPFRGVLRKRCSENMQQIYKRTPMPKCDFSATLLKSHFSMGVLHIFRTPFLNNLRTPLKGYFWECVNKFLLPPCIIPFPNLFFSFYLFLCSIYYTELCEHFFYFMYSINISKQFSIFVLLNLNILSLAIINIYLVFKIEQQRSNVLAEIESVLIFFFFFFSLGLFALMEL